MNLWPEDIAYSELRSPMTVLKEQASLLGERTKNLVTAEVENADISDIFFYRMKLGINDSVSQISNKKFAYNFNIVAPALKNYKYRLFTISFDVALYPVELYIDDDMKSQLYPGHNVPMANSETDFIAMLRDIFNSSRSKQVIHALMAQSGGIS